MQASSYAVATRTDSLVRGVARASKTKKSDTSDDMHDMKMQKHENAAQTCKNVKLENVAQAFRGEG